MYLGIDIGTSSICAICLDGKGNTVFTITKANNAHGAEKTQDPEAIFALCRDIYEELIQKYPIKCIGVSGQMHGVLYLDKNGKAVSPLYSWQDERGNLPYEDRTYSAALSDISGYRMSTGFGATSLYYDSINGKIPGEASSFCTIGDYVAMRLAGRKSPLVNSTNAASVGLFDLKNNNWDFGAIRKAKLPVDLFPTTANDIEIVGYTREGVPIYTAIGDNQASVYGVDKDNDSIIINIGTGSQVSIITDGLSIPPAECEFRPYFHNRYLALGCALCGGYSYKILKDFFNSVSDKEITYDQMNKWAESALSLDVPITSTLFKGTRADPNLKASINNLTEQNFSAPSLTLSVLKGISFELKQFYESLKPITGKRGKLIASGNAVRLNPVLCKIIEDDFKMKLCIPFHKEEAAFGAALIGAEAFEGKSLKEFIKYC